jgi:RNA polymerase sigma factor (sigma-70 family)
LRWGLRIFLDSNIKAFEYGIGLPWSRPGKCFKGMLVRTDVTWSRCKLSLAFLIIPCTWLSKYRNKSLNFSAQIGSKQILLINFIPFMKEDQYIWEEFKNGEEYALAHIYNQNIDFLFFYGKRITKDEDFLLDTIQDLFYELIRSKKNLGKTDNIRLYLLKSFRRKLIRELQKKQKQSGSNEDIDILPDIVFSVEEDMILAEEKSKQLEIVRLGMKGLNQKQREVLYYKFTLGFDYKQICEIMQVTNDSARQMVSRAINSLKKYFDENDFILMFIFRKLI